MSACIEILPLVTHRRLGVLEEGDEALLDAHVASCAECRGLVLELESALDLACATGGSKTGESGSRESEAALQGWARLESEIAQRERIALLPVRLACTYCHDALERGARVHCASCLAPYHAECFREHGRCSIAGCQETRVVQPAVLGTPSTWRTRRVVGATFLGSLVAVGLGVAAYRPSPDRTSPTPPIAQAVPIQASPAPPEIISVTSLATIFGDGGDSRQMAALVREHEFIWKLDQARGLLHGDGTDVDDTPSSIWVEDAGEGHSGLHDFVAEVTFRVEVGSLDIVIHGAKDDTDKALAGHGGRFTFLASEHAGEWQTARIQAEGQRATVRVGDGEPRGVILADPEGLLGFTLAPGSVASISSVRLSRLPSANAPVEHEGPRRRGRRKAAAAAPTPTPLAPAGAERTDLFADLPEELQLGNDAFEWQLRTAELGRDRFSLSKQRLTITNPGDEPIVFGKHKRSWREFSLRFHLRFERGTKASLLGRISAASWRGLDSALNFAQWQSATTWDEIPLCNTEVPDRTPGQFAGIPDGARAWTSATLEFRIAGDHWDVIVDGQAPRPVALVSSARNESGGFGFLVRHGQIEVEDLYARILTSEEPDVRHEGR